MMSDTSGEAVEPAAMTPAKLIAAATAAQLNLWCTLIVGCELVEHEGEWLWSVPEDPLLRTHILEPVHDNADAWLVLCFMASQGAGNAHITTSETGAMVAMTWAGADGPRMRLTSVLLPDRREAARRALCEVLCMWAHEAGAFPPLDLIRTCEHFTHNSNPRAADER